MLTIEERLILNRFIDPITHCWLFTGKARHGKMNYGAISYQGKKRRTHCVAYEVWVGPIPVGKQINHHCDKALCFNPEHLYAGTQQENIKDMMDRGRHVPGRSTNKPPKEVCKHGHSNWGLKSTGKRYCKECAKIDTARRRISQVR